MNERGNLEFKFRLTNDDMKFSTFFDWFYKLRWVTICVWAVVLGVAGYHALGFLQLTNVNFIPPDDSAAAEARRVYAEQFPDVCAQSRFVVLLRRADANSTAYPDVFAGNWSWEATARVVAAARAFAEDPGLLVSASGRFTHEGQYDPDDAYAREFLQRAFVARGNQSTIVLLATREHSTQRVFRWVAHMRAALAALDTRGGVFSADLIGFDTLIRDMSTGAAADLRRMDSVALPVALLVFVAVLRSLTAAVVPVVAVAASVVLCFGAMVPVAAAVDIPSYCPAIMMSIVIAMSIDYCLFLLTRFHEELARGRAPRAAAEAMLRHSGATILTSGAVLTVCLASLLAFPLRIIVAVGIGASVALLSTMLTALTLVPALICIGLPFFSIQGLCPCCSNGKCKDKNSKNKNKDLDQEDDKGKNITDSNNTEKEGTTTLAITETTTTETASSSTTATLTYEEKQFEKEKKSYWFRFPNFVTTVPRALVDVVVVCALLAPFCCGLLRLELVVNEDHVLPRRSETHAAIARFTQDWPVGELFTFDVVAVAHERGRSVFTPDFYDVCHRLARDIAAHTEDFGPESVLSPADIGDRHVDYDLAAFLLATDEFAYTHVFAQQVNANRTAARMTLAARRDPNLNASRVPAQLRPILANYSASTNYSFYLTNRIVDMNDAVARTLEVYPWAVLIMAAVISVTVVAALQALLLPLRMVLTIALTVVWSYGVLALVFATDWFYWLSPNLAAEPGVCWIVPVLSLPMLVGLALDYDIFLFTRIREYRRRGWAPRAAVVRGVAKTGAVITYAGIIMAVAFSGLAFSGLMLMNQFGVLLALCVLLDTFVVRTTLNPALVYLFADANYWPRHYPVKYHDPTVFHPEAEPGDSEQPPETTPLLVGSADTHSIQHNL